MRIARRIAQSGICSRREAELWIARGHVSVDGIVLTTPALNVTPEQAILVKGKPLPDLPEEAAIWLFHKPPGCITTRKDPEKRATVYDRLPKELARALTVGRLDYNTEGLLLLTNNGDLAHHMAHPSTGWERTYRVRVFGAVDVAKLTALRQGLTVQGRKGEKVTYGAVLAELEKTAGGRNSWLKITLREGKNREVRNICEYLGLTVNKLIRVQYGPFKLGGLPLGAVQEAPQHLVRKLLEKAAKGKAV